MAVIEYYFVKVKETKTNNYLEKDFTQLIKTKVDNLKLEEKYCENRTCSAILAEYIENNESNHNITFDFSKLTGETVTSALRYNLLENIDTFKDLDEKTMALVNYTVKDFEEVKEVIIANNNIKEIIKSLEKMEKDFFQIYKIIKENNLNRILDKKDLSNEFYKKHLKRYKKDKTFFNSFSIKNTNVLQFQNNVEAFDFRKLEEYINKHLLKEDGLYVLFEKIYDSEFLEMLKYRELSSFEIKYHSTAKDNLLNSNLNNLLFQIADSFGKNQTKISAKADKDSTLSNEKVLSFFESVNELGILDECKVRVSGNRSSIKSTDKGASLKYTTRSHMKTLATANLVFLDAYDKKIDIIEERII